MSLSNIYSNDFISHAKHNTRIIISQQIRNETINIMEIALEKRN